MLASPSAGAEGGTSCRLTVGEQVDSVLKFEPLANFLTKEERCFNCHGGVNPHIDGTGIDPDDTEAPTSAKEHGGGRIPRLGDRSADGTITAETGTCLECHNSMAKKTADGSPSAWMTAPGFLSFIGKDAPTLCKQIKGHNRTAEHFLGHLEDDNGGNNFGHTAFAGGCGLEVGGPYENERVACKRPSIGHADLMKLAHAWVDTMGAEKFDAGDASCGCEVKLKLDIEHQITSRRDHPRVAVGGPIYDGTVRFELQLAPFPAMPGQQRNKSEIPLVFTGETTVVREFSVGHIASKAAGEGTQTETWRVDATLDPESETLKLRVGIYPDEMDAWWDGPGGRSEVTVPLISELGETMDRSKAPLSIPYRNGSRQTFASNGQKFQETLTVTVP